jgi:hypothetical protein
MYVSATDVRDETAFELSHKPLSTDGAEWKFRSILVTVAH